MPATMVRGSGSPISTLRCSSLSAPLTGSAESTWPTRRSTLAKSSNSIFGDGGCDADSLPAARGLAQQLLPGGRFLLLRVRACGRWRFSLRCAGRPARSCRSSGRRASWPQFRLRRSSVSSGLGHAELCPDLRRRFRQNRMQQRDGDAQQFRPRRRARHRAAAARRRRLSRVSTEPARR